MAPELWYHLVMLKILILLINLCFSQENSDAFIVKFFPQKARVIGPAKWSDQNQGIIVENETLEVLTAKIATASGELIKHVRVPARTKESFLVQYPKGEKIEFVPLSPPLQKFPLIYGKKAYEIPSKR